MARRPLALALVLLAALCAAWTIFAGKDLNWDLLNYHYYGPFELLEGRLRQDYFAASGQSYVNPIGYVPFYLMVSAGWHSVLVSVFFAIAHSLCLALLYLIARRLFPQDLGMAVLATALGGATSVYWATVGTSFLDPLLVVPMLAGVVLLLDRRHFALAGVLFGAAAGLKYSNAIFALAAIPFVLNRKAFFSYALGGAAAVAAFAGPWLYLMWREFGHPLFPMGQLNLRFAPQDLLAALAFPFRMAALDRSLYVETFAPDLRPAALIAFAVALPFFRKGPALGDPERRLLTFFIIGVVLWLLTSANGRYGMLLLLLAGVLLARLAERVVPQRAKLILGLLLVVQIAMLAVASHARWYLSEPWSHHWFPYAVPERAQREPALYLTLETLPMAVVAPFVHPDSAYVNLRGQRSLSPEDPKLVALLEKHRGHVRALGRVLELKSGAPDPAQVVAYDGTLTRLGYRMDVADCFTIAWRPDREDVLSRMANALSAAPNVTESLSVVSCGLVPAPRDPARAERERRASVAFDSLQKACPRLFRGQTAVTEPLGGGWSRHYVDLDARLEAFGERVMLNRYRAGEIVELGRLGEWEKGGAALPAACR